MLNKEIAAHESMAVGMAVINPRFQRLPGRDGFKGAEMGSGSTGSPNLSYPSPGSCVAVGPVPAGRGV